MTPQDKAIELVNKYWRVNDSEYCALIAVEEILLTVNMCIPYLNAETYTSYWQEVKEEIEKYTKP
jgi:hypothetical protein